MTRPDVYKDCTKDCERTPECSVCRKFKAPRGRSVPLAMENSRCNFHCPGYDQDPRPGHLWPGELAQYDDAQQEPKP